VSKFSDSLQILPVKRKKRKSIDWSGLYHWWYPHNFFRGWPSCYLTWCPHVICTQRTCWNRSKNSGTRKLERSTTR